MNNFTDDGIYYNVKRYHYAESTQVRIYKNPLCRGTKKEENIESDKSYTDKEIKDRKEKSSISSKNRTIQSIYGIARANTWDMFLTLTFDRNIVDSSDYSFVTKISSKWLNNLKSRIAPDMKYILVPELHADGEHWHLHGLLSNCSQLKLTESGIVKNNKMIYNLDNWKYGFSTVTLVEDSSRVSSYITKYITKELCERSEYKRRYWASKNCLRANDVLTIDLLADDEKIDYMASVADDISYIKTLDYPRTGQTVKYLELEL